MEDLRDVKTHFAFGENWAEYAANIDEIRINEAQRGLLRMLKPEEIFDKTFFDIGCGSGLHSLAALRLGARTVVAIDIDEKSATTTKKVLATYAPDAQYAVSNQSVFDFKKSIIEQFDIVYSWGVLHHTGDMYKAITEAASAVRPGGLLAIALYRKTAMCWLWKYIKRWYAHTSKINQVRFRKIYIFLKKIRFELGGRDFVTYQKNYYISRGMSFEHDVHDWLGGYPYESITPETTEMYLESIGFSLVRSNVNSSGLGLFGSGCNEFVFIKRQNFEC